MQSPLLRLEKVSKSYPKSPNILREVDLSVERGDYIVVRGRSGIGKSTLLRILSLLDRPTSGRVFVAEKDTGNLGDSELSRIRLEEIGFVFQQFNLIPALTNLENVELPMELEGRVRSRGARREKARELLSYFGLASNGFEDKFPSEMSVGEQQRIAVARALANSPKLLIADEPTASLDEENSEVVLNLFRKINSEKGIAIILSTTSFTEKYHASTSEFEIMSGKLRRLR
jgi:ABC-type lipoprotein export system ATPase subunit